MIATTLKRLFEADTTAPDYRETAPSYELHGQLGWPPWWPMLCDVWKYPDPPEDLAGTAMHQHWHSARAELMGLYEQYRQQVSR